MDIPAIVKMLPLEFRVEAQEAIRSLEKCKVFELIRNESEKEVLQAAMVLAHNREYEAIERVSIRAAMVKTLLEGLIEATMEMEN